MLITLKVIRLRGQDISPGKRIRVEAEEGKRLIDSGYARRLTREETQEFLSEYAETFLKLEEEHIRETRPCHWCGGTDKWESIYGAIVCSHCYPPINPRLVKRWIGEKAFFEKALES